MGKDDNRKSLKMRQRRRQAKLKARTKRVAVATRAARGKK